MTPSSQSVEVTHTATFTTTVRGVGSSSFTYQWRRKQGHRNKLIKRETGPILKFDKVLKRDQGRYSCYVENMYGDFTASNTVYLTVTSKNYNFLMSIV